LPEQVVGLVDLRVYPNPFSERLNIRFISTSNAHAIVDLYNINGNLIERVFDGNVVKGQIFNAEYKPKNIVSQIIIYRLTIDNKIHMGKLIYRETE